MCQLHYMHKCWLFHQVVLSVLDQGGALDEAYLYPCAGVAGASTGALSAFLADEPVSHDCLHQGIWTLQEALGVLGKE